MEAAEVPVLGVATAPIDAVVIQEMVEQNEKWFGGERGWCESRK
jgi:hypothetical protein